MRRRISALAAGLLVLSLAPAQAASLPWSGYRTVPADRADAGFVGARKTDGKITYRLDADAQRTSEKYGPRKRLDGGRDHARAAWILSKYGDVRVADRAAAVDVAIFALMSDKKVSGPRAKARLRPTGRSEVIRSLARRMLKASTKYAGPYAVQLTTVPGFVGGQVSAQVRVTSYAGNPVAKLPVLFQIPGVAERHPTSADGIASATFPAVKIGTQPLFVTVTDVPDSRLVIREPRQKGASRIALAGHKGTRKVEGLVAVRAQPVVAVASPGDRFTGAAVVTAFSVAANEGVAARTVSVSVHGPFGAGQTPTCDTPAVDSGQTAIQGDGSYWTPPLRMSVPGVYVWRVQVAEDLLNAPAETCGGAMNLIQNND